MRVWQPGTVAQVVDNHEESVWTALRNAAPEGATVADVAAVVGRSEVVVQHVLDILEMHKLAVKGIGVSPLYWTVIDWANAVRAKLADTRTWISLNDGGDVADMATTLGVPLPMAKLLAGYVAAAGGAVTKG